MNFQITPAATMLIASGRKMMLFAHASYLTLSTSTAISRPMPTVNTVSSTSQSTLLSSAPSASLLVKNHL